MSRIYLSNKKTDILHSRHHPHQHLMENKQQRKLPRTPSAPCKPLALPVTTWKSSIPTIADNSDCYINEEGLCRELDEVAKTIYMLSVPDFERILDRHTCAPKNRCLGCGIDMGDCNPRQLCEKTHCPALID